MDRFFERLIGTFKYLLSHIMKKLITSVVFSAALIFTSVVAEAGNYKVLRGDTLAKIGQHYGVSYKDIMRANNLTCTTIYPGQVLRIPTYQHSAVRSVPVPAPSYSYSNRNSSSYGGGYNQSVKVPKKPAASIYTVRRGDTLSSICSRFKVSPRDIMSVNRLRSSNIYVGQSLRIPVRQSSGYRVAAY